MMEKLSVPIAIVIAGIFIAGALFYSGIANPRQVITTPIINNESASFMRPVTSDDHMLGNPKADVVIVEYSDTECPFCKQFHVTLKRVMAEYGNAGKVAWVYRTFPLVSLHSKARKEAEALECANE